MPETMERYYRKEAKRRTRETNIQVSRAEVIREVLTEYFEKASLQCQRDQSEKEPATCP